MEEEGIIFKLQVHNGLNQKIEIAMTITSSILPNIASQIALVSADAIANELMMDVSVLDKTMGGVYTVSPD